MQNSMSFCPESHFLADWIVGSKTVKSGGNEVYEINFGIEAMENDAGVTEGEGWSLVERGQ